MSWNDLALNPRVILGYYSSPPVLDVVEVHSLSLHRDGPTLEMVVELPAFPDRPSPRWPASANAARAHLRFLGLREIRIEGWGVSNIGPLSISPGSGGVRFEFRSGTAACVGVSDGFDVAEIRVYSRETA